MHNILCSYSHHTLNKLLEDRAGLNLGQMTTSQLDKALEVTTIAKLHHQVVIRVCLGTSDHIDDMSVRYLSHDLDFINEHIVSFTADALTVYDFDRVILLWIIFQITIVYGTILAFAELFWS